MNWQQYQNKELRKYTIKKIHSEIIPTALAIILSSICFFIVTISACEFVFKMLF